MLLQLITTHGLCQSTSYAETMERLRQKSPTTKHSNVFFDSLFKVTFKKYQSPALLTLCGGNLPTDSGLP